MNVACPNCGITILLKPGGWPFIRSQILIHLITVCRPDHETMELLADRLADIVASKNAM